MDITRANEILRKLADGIDPMTGEVLPAESICNNVEVVRAFHCILEELNHPVKNKRPQPENAGKPWTEAELEKLKNEFDSHIKQSEIAREHGRSRGAIEAKLAHLGLIENSYYSENSDE